MPSVVQQALIVPVLLAVLWWGYRQWIQPRAGLDLPSQAALGLVLLALVGAFLGAPFWWADLRESFSWDLPPLASRLLASAAWSFVVAAFLALRSPRGRRVHLVILMIAVYLAPLVAAILLFHLDRFDFAAPITYAFFLIAGGMSLAALWFLARPPAVLHDRAVAPVAPGQPVRLWLTLVALVTGPWGIALWLADRGPLPLVWVWPGDLLTSRLIAVMLLTIAVGALWSLRDADTGRMMLGVSLTYGLGVAVAALWNSLAGRPIPLLYLLVFGVIFVGSTLLWLRERPRPAIQHQPAR